MRKCAIVVSCLLVACSLFAAGFQKLVSSNSVCLAPAYPIFKATNYTVWATGTVYAAGKMVHVSGTERIYMAVDGGTSSTNTPTNTLGIMSDGTLDWLYVTPQKTARRVLILQNLGTNNVFYNFGTAAAINSNAFLIQNGHVAVTASDEDLLKLQIFAECSSTGNLVTVTDE